jgi:hypothetical protein
MKKQSLILLINFVALVGFFPNVLSAAMNSASYQIYADSFGVSDASVISGGSTTISGTTGELAPTTTLGGAYELRGGFSASEKGILSATVSSNSINLGTLSTAYVASGTSVLNVSTDSETGYTASISSDGNLRTGLNDIDNVSDGSVTAGSEEYGIQTTGTDALLSTDVGISGSVNIASAVGKVTDHATTITFKASTSPATVNGSYSQTVTVSVIANP